MTSPTVPAPVVALVGAGPGDPDLLTLAAEGALAVADVVLAERSLAPLLAALAAEASPAAHGTAGDERERQEPTIHWVADDRPVPELLALATTDDRDPVAGVEARPLRVVRLYRGDPWFHPAGDAERAALRAAAVRFEVISGVVEEVALAAAAGIPLQLRTLSVATTFVVDGAGEADARPLVLPADPAHGLVVRTDDLAASARRLLRSAGVDGCHLDRPAAALDRVAAGAGAPCWAERATLTELATRAPGRAGVLVVGLVAKLDVAATGVGAALVGDRMVSR